MARFFFHLRKGDEELTDAEGVVLADRATAREQATRTIRDFFQPFLGQVDPEWQEWRLLVCDENERCVFAMDFAAGAVLHWCDRLLSTLQVNQQVIYLEVERMRRGLFVAVGDLRHLRDLKAMLLDQNRNERDDLRKQMMTSAGVRQRTGEVVARSRQQSRVSPWEMQHVAPR